MRVNSESKDNITISNDVTQRNYISFVSRSCTVLETRTVLPLASAKSKQDPGQELVAS